MKRFPRSRRKQRERAGRHPRSPGNDQVARWNEWEPLATAKCLVHRRALPLPLVAASVGRAIAQSRNPADTQVTAASNAASLFDSVFIAISLEALSERRDVRIR